MMRLLAGAALAVALACPARAAEQAQAKVIAAYVDRDTTKLVIESSGPLVSGRLVYVGPQAVPFTLGDLASRNEFASYYAASAPGKPDVHQGDAVSLEAPKAMTVPQFFSINMKERYNFEQKRVGAVTAVMGDRAMVDKGSINEVRERDLYRIYDSSGHYKGLIELRGIGDFQSQGKLYNALEDFHHDALKTSPGDRVVFAGQRKLFALGALGALAPAKHQILDTPETTYGAGLLWNVTFPDGWGLEILFGTFSRSGTGNYSLPGTFFGQPGQLVEHNEVNANYILPIWVKKNFFYPSVVSPFLAVGLSYFSGLNNWSAKEEILNGIVVSDQSGSRAVHSAAPVLGAGIELFPGRFFRPRAEVRYFAGPKIDAGGNTYYTSSVFYSLGFLTTW